MKKSIIFLILALTIISLSVVSASENATDLDGPDVNDEVISSDVPPDEVNDTGVEYVKEDSEISANYTKGYENFKTEFTVTLTSNGTDLASKKIIINFRASFIYSSK